MRGLGIVLGVSGGVGTALLLRAWAKARDERDRAAILKLAAEAGVAQIAHDRAKLLAVHPVFQPAVVPAIVPVAPPAVPRQIPDSPLTPEAGRLYRVVVNVNFPASLAAGVSDVKRQAEKSGFQDVLVSKTKPQGWPGSVNGDYYVTATYAGGPASMARSYLGGEVAIKDVWEG
jgi:hypothetical protein